MYCNYLFLLYCLPFHSLNVIFWWTEAIKSNWSTLPNISSFCVQLKQSAYSKIMKILFCVCCENNVILHVIFRSMIHLKLVFIYDERQGSRFFLSTCRLSFDSFIEKTHLSPLCCNGTSVVSQTQYVVVFLEFLFCSIGLFSHPCVQGWTVSPQKFMSNCYLRMKSYLETESLQATY